MTGLSKRKRLPAAGRVIVTAGLAATLVGCYDLDLAPIFGTGLDGCVSFCGVDFAVSPPGGWMLFGDTLRLSTWSTEGHDSATWASTSDAVPFVTTGGLRRDVRSLATSVLVQARSIGAAGITARAKDTTFREEVWIHVADSSAITAISLQAPQTLKVGIRFPIAARLQNSLGSEVHGAPTAWSNSNDQVLEVVSMPAGIDVIGRKAGSAVITATFLGVSQSATITVIP